MAKRSDKEIREEEILDMRAVMDLPRGRRLIRRLLSGCGIFLSVMRPRTGVRPEDLPLFNGAQRDIGLWIMDEAQTAHPVAYEKMNSEAVALNLMERESDNPHTSDGRLS
jgi:hypothetical protein